MKLRILGCGTSSGVPRIGNDWGRCDPDNPRNLRSRASIMVSLGGFRLLVDTSPDMRMQLLDAGVGEVDAVIWTHDHADHCHGIDDLRQVMHLKGAPVRGLAREFTLDQLRQRFAYAFFGWDLSGLFSDELRNAPWSFAKVVDLLSHLWLPILTLAWDEVAILQRTMRANLLDELNKPYVTSARAGGLSETTLIWEYPVRVALNPFVSAIGFALPELISSATLVSIVLSLPLTGPLFLTALQSQDMYLAGAFVLLMSALVVTRRVPPEYGKFFAWPGFVWLALLFYLAIALGIAEIPRRVLLRRATLVPAAVGAGPDPVEPVEVVPDPSRRLFISRSVAIGSGIAAGGVVGYGMTQALGAPERGMLDAYASLPAPQRKLVRELVANLARAYQIAG